MMQRRFFIARVYANYEAAVRTIEQVDEHMDLEGAELEWRRLSRSGEPRAHSSLIVTAGTTWEEAELELKARLGD